MAVIVDTKAMREIALKPKKDTAEPKQLGRPKTLPNGKIVALYLDFPAIDYAKKLGDGNISKGIRAVMARYVGEK